MDVAPYFNCQWICLSIFPFPCLRRWCFMCTSFNQCQLYHYRIIACLHRLTAQFCSFQPQAFSLKMPISPFLWAILLVLWTPIGNILQTSSWHPIINMQTSRWSTVGREQEWVLLVHHTASLSTVLGSSDKRPQLNSQLASIHLPSLGGVRSKRSPLSFFLTCSFLSLGCSNGNACSNVPSDICSASIEPTISSNQIGVRFIMVQPINDAVERLKIAIEHNSPSGVMKEEKEQQR